MQKQLSSNKSPERSIWIEGWDNLKADPYLASLLIASAFLGCLVPGMLWFSASGLALIYTFAVFVGYKLYPYQVRFVKLLLVFLCVAGVVSYAEPSQAAFSFLFDATQKVLKKCVLDKSGITQLASFSSMIFGALRAAFMIGLGVAGWMVWNNRREGQEYQNVLSLIMMAFMVVMIIGVIEPLVVGTPATACS